MAINSIPLVKLILGILGNHLTGFNLVRERRVGMLPPRQTLLLPPTISRNTVLYRLEVTALIGSGTILDLKSHHMLPVPYTP